MKYSPETRRKAIELYLARCPQREIAARLGASEGIVNDWIRKARKSLEFAKGGDTRRQEGMTVTLSIPPWEAREQA